MTDKAFLIKTIHELVNAKKAFLKSEDRFSELFEIVPEAISLMQLNPLRFIKMNGNAQKLLEYPLCELLQKKPDEISPPFQPDGSRSDEKAMYYIQQTLNGEKPVFEWLLQTGSGKHIFVEARLVLLYNYEEPLIYSSFVDITERKLAETRLIEQNRNLAEIAFLQSHQVRQPVAHILGLINLLKGRQPNDPDSIEITDMIYKAAGSFDDIIRQIVLKTHQISKGS